MADETVALYIDAENLIIPVEQKLGSLNLARVLDRMKEEGLVIVSRAYGDWTKGSSPEYVKEFAMSGIEMIELHSDQRGKNTADIQLSLDAMELCLSPLSPSVFALVSGDRDFIPLVQKLKLYKKKVICMSTDDTVSIALKRISDLYINYFNLIPDESSRSFANKSTSRPLLSREAKEQKAIELFPLMIRAIDVIQRRGQTPKGSNTNVMMRQIDSSFDLETAGFSGFQELVEFAEARNAVCLVGERVRGTDIELDLGSEAQTYRQLSSDSALLPFGTPDEALKSYRILLEWKRIPLIGWKQRKQLLTHAVTLLSETTPLSFNELRDRLLTYVREIGYIIQQNEVIKLIYTMNIARCFSLDGVQTSIMINMERPHSCQMPLDDVLLSTNLVYLNAIILEAASRGSDVQFIPEAVALLLFDSNTEDDVKHATVLIQALNGEPNLVSA